MNGNDIRLKPDQLPGLKPGLYADAGERERHAGIMLEIANDLHRPLQEVADRYEALLAEMKPQASVPDYLPILVAKKLRETYR